jgi:tetratricopeptide (TPR) repeat protein
MQTPDPFAQTIETALENFADPAWLGAHCPLAAPFVLGGASSNAETAKARGEHLQNALRAAAQSLSPEHRQLLDASFFQRNWQHNINGVAMTLSMSRAAYYRHRAAALHALTEAFAKSLAPTVQLEQPKTPSLLLGRDGMLQVALQQLQAGQAVSISGASGLGKTALGQAIGAQFAAKAGSAFWFTVRPPLNDHLNGFAFALAHHLKQAGASQAWRQLIADSGATKPDVLLGLLQFDLAQLKAPLLVCIDEVDLLSNENAPHAALLQVLEVLRSHTSLLLIGQRQTLLAQHAITLNGLEMADALALLAAHGIATASMTTQTAQQVLEATHGNPLLLSLFASLYMAGEPTALLLRQLARRPNVPVLLERLWARLSDDERALWCSVAVCRQPAPLDAWPDDVAALQTLAQRSLVREHEGQAVYVLPPVRDFVLAKAKEANEAMLAGAHAYAARLFEVRARFTSAAWHYVQARMPEQAIWLWFQHRERETARGLAQSAQAIFAGLDTNALRDEEAQRTLALLRAEWRKLAGQAEEGLAELREARWSSNHPQFGYAQRLRGNLQEMRGQLDQAAAAYREGLHASFAQHTHERIRMWTAQGYAHYRQGEMREVRYAALQAQIEAMDFRGFVEAQMGNYAEAEMVLREGLGLAEQARLDNENWIAKLHERLGTVMWQLGKHDEAVKHLQTAMQLYEQMGDSITPLYQHMNLAAAYIVAGEYDEALHEALPSLARAHGMNHAYLIAGLSLNAAEASFYLGQLDEAERYAMQCMNQEEMAVQPYAFTVVGMVQRARGQTPSSQTTLRTAIANARQIEDRYAEACAWRELGRTSCAANATDVTEAKAAFDEALRLFEAMGLAHEVTKTQAERDADTK